MTTLSYKMPANRSQTFLQRLAVEGYHGHVSRRPLLSPVYEIEIEDVDDHERGHVRDLVRALEPLADPVLTQMPEQRRK